MTTSDGVMDGRIGTVEGDDKLDAVGVFHLFQKISPIRSGQLSSVSLNYYIQVLGQGKMHQIGKVRAHCYLASGERNVGEAAFCRTYDECFEAVRIGIQTITGSLLGLFNGFHNAVYARVITGKTNLDVA